MSWKYRLNAGKKYIFLNTVTFRFWICSSWKKNNQLLSFCPFYVSHYQTDLALNCGKICCSDKNVVFICPALSSKFSMLVIDYRICLSKLLRTIKWVKKKICQSFNFFLNVFLKSNLLCHDGIFKWQSECIYKDKHLSTDSLHAFNSCVSTVHRMSWGWNVSTAAEVEPLSALKCNWSESTAACQRSTQWSAMLYFPFHEIQ